MLNMSVRADWDRHIYFCEEPHQTVWLFASLVIERKASLCSLEEQVSIRLKLSLDWPLASSLGFSQGLYNTGLVDGIIQWVISLVSNPGCSVHTSKAI